MPLRLPKVSMPCRPVLSDPLRHPKVSMPLQACGLPDAFWVPLRFCDAKQAWMPLLLTDAAAPQACITECASRVPWNRVQARHANTADWLPCAM